MTTTTTTQLQHPSPSNRLRRNLGAALAGAAVRASTAVLIGRVADDGPRRAGAPTTNPEAADLALMNAAIHVITPPESTADLAMINGAIHVSTAPEATAVCGGEFGWLCSMTADRVGWQLGSYK